MCKVCDLLLTSCVFFFCRHGPGFPSPARKVWMVMFWLSGWARAEGVCFLLGGVPSLVSKYIKGLLGGVEETPCACLCKCANCIRRMHVCNVELTARGNRNVVLLLSQGVSLPSLLTCTCFRITMPVSALAKNNQTLHSIFKSSAPQAWNKNCGYHLCKWPRRLQEWEKAQIYIVRYFPSFTLNALKWKVNFVHPRHSLTFTVCSASSLRL